jgi:hypothetical protein
MVYIKEDVMTDEDVNKIIADYMKYPISNDGLEIYVLDRRWEPLCEYFTDSLDALVPVWEKLHSYPMVDEDEKYLIEMLTEEVHLEVNYVWSKKDTIQLAAAHATAKAIKELK